jgi:branched-chain amino acid transport system ATP-binding protein
MALLEVSNLSRRFGGLRAVSELSFVLNEGEILGLIGPNGAGKTTAFNLMSGFLAPDTGSVRLDGHELVGLRPNAIVKRGVARTFQIVKPFRKLTVLENVVLAAFLHERRRAPATIEARHILELLGLTEKADSYASDLTLGQQKRLEIARCVATRPKVLFLDEPMGGLNPTEVESACDLVLKLRGTGISVVLVEHQMRAIMKISGRVLVLHHGIKIADAAPEAIVRDPAVVKAYLGEEVA